MWRMTHAPAAHALVSSDSFHRRDREVHLRRRLERGLSSVRVNRYHIGPRVAHVTRTGVV